MTTDTNNPRRQGHGCLRCYPRKKGVGNPFQNLFLTPFCAQEDLEAKVDAKYSQLSEDEIKTLVVDDKWLATLRAAVQGELDRVSQTLTGRLRQLAERYTAPLPKVIEEVDALSARVDEHLRKMGAPWN